MAVKVVAATGAKGVTASNGAVVDAPKVPAGVAHRIASATIVAPGLVVPAVRGEAEANPTECPCPAKGGRFSAPHVRVAIAMTVAVLAAIAPVADGQAIVPVADTQAAIVPAADETIVGVATSLVLPVAHKNGARPTRALSRNLAATNRIIAIAVARAAAAAART